MEGAAVAHVAHLYGVPVGEVRGISNIVTDRDTSSWRIEETPPTAAQEAAARMDRAPLNFAFSPCPTTRSRFTRSCMASFRASRSRRISTTSKR